MLIVIFEDILHSVMQEMKDYHNFSHNTITTCNSSFVCFLHVTTSQVQYQGW